jgi:molybdopterin synthase sulfur carrier subunit
MVEKPAPGHFRILYFATAASFTKKPFDDFPAPLLVKDLFQLLDSKYPGMVNSVLCSCAVTVNLDYVDVEETFREDGSAIDSAATIIKEGDEVAIIPPVSSG